jgi:hypothetical protein
MTVNELIGQLNKYDGNLVVDLRISGGFERSQCSEVYVDLTSYSHLTGIKEKRLVLSDSAKGSWR